MHAGERMTREETDLRATPRLLRSPVAVNPPVIRTVMVRAVSSYVDCEQGCTHLSGVRRRQQRRQDLGCRENRTSDHTTQRNKVAG